MNKKTKVFLLGLTGILLLLLSGCRPSADTVKAAFDQGFSRLQELVAEAPGGVKEIAEVVSNAAAAQQTAEGQTEPAEPTGPAEPESYSLDGLANVYTILLIGSDRRDGSWWGNSDVLMLLSINKSKQTISLVSIMRDLGANIPGSGYGKINSALPKGGPGLAVQTIEQNFEVGINAYIFVDFSAMIQIFDIFGGIPIEVTADEAAAMAGPVWEVCTLFGLNEAANQLTSGGVYNLNGVQALSYCRQRKTGNGDYDRTARQRLVLAILYEKMKAMSVPELTNVAMQILPLVQTNLTADALSSVIPALTKSGYTVVMDRIPYDGLFSYGNENLNPAWPQTIERLRNTLY